MQQLTNRVTYPSLTTLDRANDSYDYVLTCLVGPLLLLGRLTTDGLGSDLPGQITDQEKMLPNDSCHEVDASPHGYASKD